MSKSSDELDRMLPLLIVYIPVRAKLTTMIHLTNGFPIPNYATHHFGFSLWQPVLSAPVTEGPHNGVCLPPKMTKCAGHLLGNHPEDLNEFTILEW